MTAPAGSAGSSASDPAPAKKKEKVSFSKLVSRKLSKDGMTKGSREIRLLFVLAVAPPATRAHSRCPLAHDVVASRPPHPPPFARANRRPSSESRGAGARGRRGGRGEPTALVRVRLPADDGGGDDVRARRARDAAEPDEREGIVQEARVAEAREGREDERRPRERSRGGRRGSGEDRRDVVAPRSEQNRPGGGGAAVDVDVQLRAKFQRRVVVRIPRVQRRVQKTSLRGRQSRGEATEGRPRGARGGEGEGAQARSTTH